jgi:hypothetical protein
MSDSERKRPLPIARLTRVEKAQWQRLYAMADQLGDWTLGTGWRRPTVSYRIAGQDEPCFVIFGGGSHEFRSVRFVWVEAFHDFVSRLADPAKRVCRLGCSRSACSNCCR